MGSADHQAVAVRGEGISMEGIFSPFERELIESAQLILRDGVERLKGRQGLFSTTRDKSATAKVKAAEARGALVASLVADYGSLRHEVAVAVLIDAQGRLIAIEEFPQGKATRCEISFRILAGMILKHGASVVLLAHNHPSGDNTPSKEDVDFTVMADMWLKGMDVDLVDHLVLNIAEASSITGAWR